MPSRSILCGLLGFPAPLLQSFATEEVARSLGVRVIGLAPEDLSTGTTAPDLLALYVTDESLAGCLEILRQCKSDHVHLQHMQFILASPANLTADLADAWQMGMHAYVPLRSDVDSLYYAINNFARHKREYTNMEMQLKEASDLAMLSMSASSQLGEIVRFLERSHQCDDFDQLAQLVLHTVDMLGVEGCGVIRGDGEPLYFGDSDKKAFLQRLIQDQRDRGRFVDMENRTTLNFEHISLMVRNLPEPGSEPYGRLKDVLFALSEGAEARIKAICSARAAADMDKAKLNFLAVMSHELRTPLNAVVGFAARLGRNKVGDVMSERDISAVSFLQENAQRMLDMIDKMFELTRMDSNPARERKSISVSEVLLGVLRKYEVQARIKSVDFSVDWPDRGLIAEVDQRRLQQVVSNLLENAVKFTQKGEIAVSIRSALQSGRGQLLEIIITDTGIGVAEEAQAALFRPFGNVEDYLSRDTTGVRLGLALVKKFVMDMQGDLEFSSTPGVGTTVTVRLPMTARKSQTVEFF